MLLTEYSKLMCRDDAPLSWQVATYYILKVEALAYKGQLLKTECQRMLYIIENN